jgi:hypothetical protein
MIRVGPPQALRAGSSDRRVSDAALLAGSTSQPELSCEFAEYVRIPMGGLFPLRSLLPLAAWQGSMDFKAHAPKPFPAYGRCSSTTNPDGPVFKWRHWQAAEAMLSQKIPDS